MGEKQQLSIEEQEKWIEGLAVFDWDNSCLAMCMMLAFGRPSSYLDIGSGTGAMVNFIEKLGVEVNGIDQLGRPAHPKLIQHDLREPIDLGRKYELVSSVETAEHIEPDYADQLVDTITKHAVDVIVFTAAMPGQPGLGHVNLQEAFWWRTKFYDKGFDYSACDTYRMVALLGIAKHSSHHVEANMQVFRKMWGKP